jgi:tetraacyldisaccharide 4'-kinase
MPIPFRPDFWERPSLAASLLAPAGQAYAAAAALRRALATPYRAPVPVICVGNLVVGGAGKTPVVESLARLLRARGQIPHILSRGYGGRLAGPVAVDPAKHGASEVGDEPAMLARAAPVWIARDRAAGARAASAGATCLVLDDGFQNPTVAKDFSLLVIDGAYGLGNGKILPAGPLRERAAAGFARADAVVLIGEDATGIERRLRLPVLRAALTAIDGAGFAGRKLVAFAGIDRPEKFFASLAAAGATLVATRAFPDHYPYRQADLARLASEAADADAALVTTEKDRVRLSPGWQARIETLRVRVTWQDEAALFRLIDPVLRHG